MANGAHWLPGKRNEVIEMAGVWHTVLITPNESSVNAMVWDIPMEKVLELRIRYDECVEYQHKTKAKTITVPEKALFKIEYAALIVAMTDLHDRFYLKDFPPEALAALGLPPRRTGRGEPKPKPTDHVEFRILLDVYNHSVTAHYRIAGSQKRGKGGYHGVEVRTWILPASAPAIINPEHAGWMSVVDTASPWSRVFTDETLFGQKLYIAMRWENGSVNGEGDDGKGPWSAIQSILIP
jgi:hypothetical protein